MKTTKRKGEIDMDNEFMGKEFDSTFEALVGFMNSLPKSTIKILNVERYQQMLQTAAKLTDLLKESYLDGEINIEVDQIFNIGSINIELNSLEINNTDIFAELIRRADNFEVCPLTNGNVELNIVFQSVLKSVV